MCALQQKRQQHPPHSRGPGGLPVGADPKTSQFVHAPCSPFSLVQCTSNSITVSSVVQLGLPNGPLLAPLDEKQTTLEVPASTTPLPGSPATQGSKRLLGQPVPQLLKSSTHRKHRLAGGQSTVACKWLDYCKKQSLKCVNSICTTAELGSFALCMSNTVFTWNCATRVQLDLANPG